MNLEEGLGFSFKTVQTNNGLEFTNDADVTEQLTIFEEILKFKRIEFKKICTYSTCQNGIVERSHREDVERFYTCREFTSVKALKKAHRCYVNRGNNIHRKILDLSQQMTLSRITLLERFLRLATRSFYLS